MAKTSNTTLNLKVNARDLNKLDKDVKQAFNPKTIQSFNKSVSRLTAIVSVLSKNFSSLNKLIDVPVHKNYDKLSDSLKEAKNEAQELRKELDKLKEDFDGKGRGRGSGRGGGRGRGGGIGFAVPLPTAGGVSSLAGQAVGRIPLVGAALGGAVGGTVAAGFSMYGTHTAFERQRQSSFAMLGGGTNQYSPLAKAGRTWGQGPGEAIQQANMFSMLSGSGATRQQMLSAYGMQYEGGVDLATTANLTRGLGGMRTGGLSSFDTAGERTDVASIILGLQNYAKSEVDMTKSESVEYLKDIADLTRKQYDLGVENFQVGKFASDAARLRSADLTARAASKISLGTARGIENIGYGDMDDSGSSMAMMVAAGMQSGDPASMIKARFALQRAGSGGGGGPNALSAGTIMHRYLSQFVGQGGKAFGGGEEGQLLAAGTIQEGYKGIGVRIPPDVALQISKNFSTMSAKDFDKATTAQLAALQDPEGVSGVGTGQQLAEIKASQITAGAKAAKRMVALNKTMVDLAIAGQEGLDLLTPAINRTIKQFNLVTKAIKDLMETGIDPEAVAGVAGAAVGKGFKAAVIGPVGIVAEASHNFIKDNLLND